jgi:DNA repair exonuclease SbcCD ATPase subunit
MKIGDLLLLKGYINKKQLTSALHKQADEAINYNRSVPLGKVLIEMELVTVDEIAEALNDQKINKPKVKEEKKVMAHKIGEDTSLQMNLKTIGVVILMLLSGFAGWFSVTSAVEDNTKEIDNIKSMGDLKIISYKLGEYDETFKELKSLSTTLQPLASDLTYIKTELDKLKNKKVNMPEIDLSGIDDCKNKLDALSAKISAFEDRVTKLEKRSSSGGRF